MANGSDHNKDILFFIPHTHWEGAVFKTREDYLDMGLPNILRALALLKAHPDYRFVLDQACYVKPFLERYPHEEAAFRRFIAEGRLAIAGGTDVMLDVNMPGGESFVRQVLYGKSYFRDKLGVDVTVAWPLDTFGHHPQIPQLYRLAGFTSFWFFRGVPSWDTPAEFIWEGIDGSRIDAYWLPQGYAVAYGSPRTLPEFAAYFKNAYDSLAPFARARGRVALAGADVTEPEAHIPDLVAAFNRLPDAPFEVRIATPADYEAWVSARTDRPVLRADLNPIFQGIYSSRIELKQQTRELERLLLAAEKLAVIRQWLGVPADAAALWQAWEPMLFNQTHDLMSGVMTDYVYDDVLRSNDFSRRLAHDAVQAGLRDIAARIDTRGPGIPIVVFNDLAWPRTDVVYAPAGLGEAGARGASLIDATGRPVPVQLLDVQRHDDGSLAQVTAAFVARDVPALGFAVYHLIPGPAGAAPEPADAGPAVLENEYYRVTCDPASGALTSLVVKSGGWEALSGPANVVVLEDDHGDLWEPYHPLDGGSRIGMKTPHPLPPRGQAAYSDEADGPPGAVQCGPVVSEFTVTRPFGKDGRLSTVVRLVAGLPRIDIRTRILNNQSFVRYRALFPTAIHGGSVVHEIPYGAIQRPVDIEFPAQHWADYGDGRRGVALFNRGLPGHNLSGDTLLLSLVRSSSIVAYGFGGGYEPGMSSDTGLELGRTLCFDYALAPHDGDWAQASIWRDGAAFNHPLMAVTESAHPGALPAQWSFLEVAGDSVVLSALKPGRDGSAVLRVYEAAGRPARGVRIALPAGVVSAEEVNLVEDVLRPLPVTGSRLELDLAPFEIRTIAVRFERPA